jgi:hypothetical protein
LKHPFYVYSMTRICYWGEEDVMISLLLIIIGYQSGNVGYGAP